MFFVVYQKWEKDEGEPLIQASGQWHGREHPEYVGLDRASSGTAEMTALTELGLWLWSQALMDPSSATLPRGCMLRIRPDSTHVIGVCERRFPSNGTRIGGEAVLICIGSDSHSV